MGGVHAGHPGRYKDCDHPDCHAHRARYVKRWHYERAQGRKRLTDAAPARRHIDTLIGAGWSLRAIAGAADISPSTVHKILTGQPTVRRTIAAAILAVDVDQVPAKPSRQTVEPFVSRVGAVRRLQALIALGWPHSQLSARSGLNTAVLLNQQGRWVTRSTHDKIAALYRELSATPGPSERSRGWARRFGYLTPAAWDDIDHDPEPCTDDAPADVAYLDEQAIWRRMLGDKTVRLTKAEKAELHRRWAATRRSLNELERVTGINSARKYDDPTQEAS